MAEGHGKWVGLEERREYASAMIKAGKTPTEIRRAVKAKYDVTMGYSTIARIASGEPDKRKTRHKAKAKTPAKPKTKAKADKPTRAAGPIVSVTNGIERLIKLVMRGMQTKGIDAITLGRNGHCEVIPIKRRAKRGIKVSA